jgi:hypothetical protein
MRFDWLRNVQLVPGNSVQECWRNLFLADGIASAHLDDMALDWLGLPAQGSLTGSLDDRWRAYWCTLAPDPITSGFSSGFGSGFA